MTTTRQQCKYRISGWHGEGKTWTHGPLLLYFYHAALASESRNHTPTTTRRTEGQWTGRRCSLPEVAPEDSSDTPDDPVGWTIPRNEDNDESGVWSVGASMCGGVEARTGAPCFRLDPPPGWAVSSRAAGAAGRVNHDSVTVYYNHIIFDFYFKKVLFYFAHKS